MAGDDDPKSSGLEDKDDGDPYDERFSEEELQNLMSNQNPNLMDFAFTDNPLPPPPPPPHPVTIATTDIIETGMLNQLSLTIPNSDVGTDDFLVTSFDDDIDLSWDLSDIPPEFLYDNVDSNTLGEIGTNHNNGDNNGCGTGRLEVSTRVFVENGPNLEPGGGSSASVAPITPSVSNGILVCTCCNLLRTLLHSNGINYYIYVYISFRCLFIEIY